MTSQLLQKLGNRTAITSFVGGFLIFMLYYFTTNENFIFAGLIYILVASILNLIVLTFLFSKANKDKQNKNALLRTSGFILLNIPTTFLFLWFGGLLLNTMRITLINSTNHDISEVALEGCETKFINTIKSGESRNVWIAIPGECGIYMTYKQGKVKKKEMVVGYLTRLMGGKETHVIGTKDVTGISQ